MTDNMTAEPIFAAIFAESWASLPPILKTHYANRPFCRDQVRVSGELDIYLSPLMRLISPLLGLLGMLTPMGGQGVPVEVTFRSYPESTDFHFERLFYFKGRKPVRFFSKMRPIGPHQVLEYMGPGLAWHAHYDFVEHQVVMRHLGFAWHIFGKNIYLPRFFNTLIGEGHACESPISEGVNAGKGFDMSMELTSPLWGKLYGYRGRFIVTDVALND